MLIESVISNKLFYKTSTLFYFQEEAFSDLNTDKTFLYINIYHYNALAKAMKGFTEIFIFLDLVRWVTPLQNIFNKCP